MYRSLLSNKFALIGLVALGILLPLSMIEDLVGERARFHEAAITDMARTATGNQRIVGPVLRVPCTETRSMPIAHPAEDGPRERSVERDCSVAVLPELLSVDGTLVTEERRRGLHAALFYGNSLAVRARFVVPERFGVFDGDASTALGAASLNLGISDPRGIVNAPQVSVADQVVDFTPGSALPVLGPGMRAALGQLHAGQVLEVAFELVLRGHRRFELVPVGRDNQVTLGSAWPHPSFVGNYLPTTRDISADGFRAAWSIGHFATGLDELFARHGLDPEFCAEIAQRAFGVALVDPVDLYTQADRAVKYGFLFVALTFLALLGTEFARGLRLHPLQYTMVGIALALFFLLLLSLAEHLGFRSAYLAAAGASDALLAFYLGAITRSRTVGAVFALTLAALYALLYGILAMEDYALLSGSLFVFGVLAAVMVATRHVDFYALGESLRRPGEGTAEDSPA
ncbi:MAG: cell envelope integrity protein CreD [Gammaproteobacteria bacterium]|nr:cell envelope integrity protein CreD [Gammaproteobacteria bacterium]